MFYPAPPLTNGAIERETFPPLQNIDHRPLPVFAAIWALKRGLERIQKPEVVKCGGKSGCAAYRSLDSG